MFVLPVGLEAKTRDFPYATVALFGLTLLLAMTSLKRTADFEKRAAANESTRELIRARQSIALAACPQIHPHPDCEFLKKVLHPEKQEEPMLMLRRIGEELGRAKVNAHRLAHYVFEEEWKDPTPAIQALPEYQNFVRVRKAALIDQTRLDEEFGLLSRNTYSALNLFLAQVFHSGWMHLIGNMLFFLLFAVPLEQRIGALPLLLIYVIGGSVGLSFQVLTAADPARPLLGASANVFAVAAAFMVAFWRHRMRVLVSFMGAVNQVVQIRTWIFFPLLLLANEVSGVVEPSGSNIAHTAHLAGFVAGGVLAFIALNLRPVSAGLIYPFEEWMLKKSRDLTDPNRKLEMIAELLFFHPACRPALQLAADMVAEWPGSWTEMSANQKSFVKAQLRNLMIVRQFPALFFKNDWPFSELIPSQRVPELMKKVNALVGRDPETALALLNVLIAIETRAGSSQVRKRNLDRMLLLKQDLERKDSGGSESAA